MFLVLNPGKKKFSTWKSYYSEHRTQPETQTIYVNVRNNETKHDTKYNYHYMIMVFETLEGYRVNSILFTTIGGK